MSADATPPSANLSLIDYIETRLTMIDRASDRSTMETERSIAREVTVLRNLMQEHASAHREMHQSSKTAIDKAHADIMLRFTELHAEMIDRIAAQHTFIMHHNELIQRAVDKAETTTNVRLEGMNEFRAALTSQSAEMARREYVDQAVQAAMTAGTERGRVNNVRIDEVEKSITSRLVELEKVLSARLDALHRAGEIQANKWSNLEGRMYMITAFMGFVIFIITVISFIMRELAR